MNLLKIQVSGLLAACALGIGIREASASVVWTDETSFLGQMITGQYFTDSNPTTSYSASGYGFTINKVNSTTTFTFSGTSGNPTGVGGNFSGIGDIVFKLSDGTTKSVALSGGFAGLTTGVPASTLSISELSLPYTVGISTIIVGEDTFHLVPEPATVLAGLLLLLPFGASTVRILRRNREK